MSIKVPVYKIKLAREHTATYPSGIGEEQKATAAFFHGLIGMADREHVAALFLDIHGRPTGASIIAVGSQTQVSCNVREFFKAAILASAESVVCAHNHPADIPFPSAADLRMTRRLISASRIIGIHMKDHLIVSPSGAFVSINVHGLLGSKDEAA